MIYTIGAALALFLALILLTKKGRNLADHILGIWMLVISFHIFVYYYFEYELSHYLSSMGYNAILPFLHGPFLYLYITAVSQPEKWNWKRCAAHFVLPLFILMVVLPFSILPEAEKLKILNDGLKGFEHYNIIQPVSLYSSGIFYVISTQMRLNQHQKRIKLHFSALEKINLSWLKVLSYGMGLMWVLIIFIGFDPLIYTGASIFVVTIGFFGIKQAGVFTNKMPTMAPSEGPEPGPVPAETTQAERRKYAKSGLNQDNALEVHQRLRDLMQTEKLYRESELSLQELSTRLDIHPNYLSQVINELEGMNFYDYINGLRIEEFKNLAASPYKQQYTLLALAYECGFNSKTAFNRVFKKNVGLPPSEYLKTLQERGATLQV
jgi:AraC-like DNA-binding protein